MIHWYRTHDGYQVYWPASSRQKSWLADVLIRLAAWIDGVHRDDLFTDGNTIYWHGRAIKVDDVNSQLVMRDLADPSETWYAISTRL